MDQLFSNKNVLITGGSSGIGFALAQKLSDLGANIFLLARNETRMNEAAEILRINVHNNCFIADVTSISDLDSVKEYFVSQKIKLDLLINSAGVTEPGEFVKMELEKFHWMMDINYFGTVNVIKIMLPLLTPGSTIVNISSMAAILGIYGYSAYGASKFAVRGFSDALRSELKLSGINVAIVFPPDTDTPQLVYDNLYKPDITKALSSSAGTMSAEKVADEIIAGIRKKKYLIIPGLESKLIYLASNLAGRRTYSIVDWMIRSALKQLKNRA